jgi:hypothetical protein
VSLLSSPFFFCFFLRQFLTPKYFHKQNGYVPEVTGWAVAARGPDQGNGAKSSAPPSLASKQHVLLIDINLDVNVNRFSSFFFVQIFSGS